MTHLSGRNLALWSSGLDHCTVLRVSWSTSEIKDHTFTSSLVSVLERKISGKGIIIGFSEDVGGGVIMWKRILEWELRNFSEKSVLWQYHNLCFCPCFQNFPQRIPPSTDPPVFPRWSAAGKRFMGPLHACVLPGHVFLLLTFWVLNSVIISVVIFTSPDSYFLFRMRKLNVKRYYRTIRNAG